MRLVNRKLPVDGTGPLQATPAGQALINLALDQYIGRRTSAEVDIAKSMLRLPKLMLISAQNLCLNSITPLMTTI
nr:hypothetical protein [Acinetobacter baumannii]